MQKLQSVDTNILIGQYRLPAKWPIIGQYQLLADYRCISIYRTKLKESKAWFRSFVQHLATKCIMRILQLQGPALATIQIKLLLKAIEPIRQQ